MGQYYQEKIGYRTKGGNMKKIDRPVLLSKRPQGNWENVVIANYSLKTKKCDSICDENRKDDFVHIWSLFDDEKKAFVVGLVIFNTKDKEGQNPVEISLLNMI